MNSKLSFDIFKGINTAYFLALQDIRQKYRRSVIGPFWLTISMGIMIMAMGFLFGQILKQPLTQYLPFLTCGIVLWSLISSTISDGCLGFISAESIIRQLPIPLFVHILRLVLRNVIIFAHNLIVLLLVLLIIKQSLNFVFFLAIPGFLLLLVNLLWMALLAAMVCTRYRDFGQIINSIMQIVFYVTPVIWTSDALTHRVSQVVVNINPFYHLIEIVRKPLLSETPSMLSWIFVVALGILGWLCVMFIYRKFAHRVAYWL